jgi:membrane protein required for colicin V production
MTGFDYVVLAVLALSVVLGGWRGFVREALALLGWIAAFVLAITFAKPVAQQLAGLVSQPEVRVVLAFAGIVFGTLIVAGLLGLLLAKLLRAAGLGIPDRALGAAFGLARGLLIVVAFVLAAGLTDMPREPFWREAELAPPLETAALATKPYLPSALAERIRYR